MIFQPLFAHCIIWMWKLRTPRWLLNFFAAFSSESSLLIDSRSAEVFCFAQLLNYQDSHQVYWTRINIKIGGIRLSCLLDGGFNGPISWILIALRKKFVSSIIHPSTLRSISPSSPVSACLSPFLMREYPSTWVSVLSFKTHPDKYINQADICLISHAVHVLLSITYTFLFKWE